MARVQGKNVDKRRFIGSKIGRRCGLHPRERRERSEKRRADWNEGQGQNGKTWFGIPEGDETEEQFTSSEGNFRRF